MAQKVLVETLDDIDGTPAARTIPFALDGVTYEIDLSEENAAALRDELARYISAARRTGGRKVRVATGQPATTADAWLPKSSSPSNRRRSPKRKSR
jgi:hypothetical protein